MRTRIFLLLVSGLALAPIGAPAIAGAVTPAADATRAYRPLQYDNLVLNWNEAVLAAVRQNPPRPTVTARNLHLVHSAIYDAWAAYDAVAIGSRFGRALRRPAVERSEASKSMAMSHAAHRVASALYPGQRALFDALHRALGFSIDWKDRDAASPAGVGNLAADAVLAFWATDGSNWQEDFRDPTGYQPTNPPGAAPGAAGYDPNRWQPLTVPTGKARDPSGQPVITADPASYSVQKFLTPQWGKVRPFALPSGDALRPPGPPIFGDPRPYVDARGRTTTNHEAWLEQYGEVLALHGTLDDSAIGAQRRCVAEFWADGPRSDTPPGHWNQIAQGIVLREAYGLGEAAKLYFALTGALHDAAIAAWDAKLGYDSGRPVTAIRHHWANSTVVSWAGPGKGVAAIPGSAWLPYQEATFVTPPFPEYVSGHSTFSMAAATTIARFVGSDVFHDPLHPTSIVLDLDDEPGPDTLGRFVDKDLSFERYDGPPMVLAWPSLFDAAREAGASRLYGGIHIQDANLRGLEMGRAIGEMALDRARQFFDGSATIADTAALPARP